jgi:pyruvate dehydrogenase E2 component (dihydrolipoamide acetyltransferase)
VSGADDRIVNDRRPLTPLRRITIDNLVTSRETAVPVSLFAEAAAEPLLAAKDRLQAGQVRSRITFAVLLARLLTATLVDHPDLNAGLDGDHLVRFAGIHLGIAVALPDGQLTVPVLHDAQKLGLTALATAITELRSKALAGKLSLADVRGGVVTLSSVGRAPPGMTAAPVLPAGQTAILFAGTARDAAVARAGKLVVGQQLPLSLTVDHRVVNGEPAVAFFADLVQRMEDPEPWL